MGIPVGLHLKVNDLASRGLHEEVLELLRQPLQESPDNAELQAMAGRCALELGHYEYALQCLQYAVENTPQDTGLAEELACAYRRCGRYHQAIELFDRLIEREPDRVHRVGQRGLTYLARGDAGLAEVDLRRCLVRLAAHAQELDPASQRVAEEVRAGLLKLGVDFPMPDGETLKLMRLRDNGDYKELVTRCSNLLKHPRPWLLFLRGCGRLGLGAHREAIADLTQALELAPNLVEAYRYRGQAWSRVDRQRAAADFHKYLELGDARNPEVLGQLGLVWFQLRRIDEALSPLETSLELAPDRDDGSCWEALGRCYLGKGRPEEALRAFNQALTRGPGASPETLYLRGTVLEQLGALEQAVSDYQSYLRAHPHGPAAIRAEDRLTALRHQQKGSPRKGPGFLRQLFGGK